MASKAEYLKKYLRNKGVTRRVGPPNGSGGLKLGSDDEPDTRIEQKRKAVGELRESMRKTPFQVLRKASDGEKYVYRIEDPQELPESDEEEVKVVGDNGEILSLSAEDKKKVAELIAKEEGRHPRQQSLSGASLSAPLDGHRPKKQSKKGFTVEEVVGRATQPAPGSAPHTSKETQESSEARDLSPPRRERQTESHFSQQRDEDLSPPRRAVENRDLSPPRRKLKDTDSSAPHGSVLKCTATSPQRRKENDPSSSFESRYRDPSPSRKSGDPPREAVHLEARNISPSRRAGPGQQSEAEGPDGEATHQISSGWSTVADLARSEEAYRYPSVETNDARRVIFRDKEGRIISEEEWLTLEGAKGKRKPRDRGPAPVLEWGSGLKQKEDRQSKKKQEEKLAKQPFARYELDEEYDADLKARDRWEDPLAKAPRGTKTDGMAETESGDGETMQEVQQRPTCPHDAPPNRFNIKPGYRWDGVVRGNGYEEERLKAVNRRKWEAEMAHMNNTADM